MSDLSCTSEELWESLRNASRANDSVERNDSVESTESQDSAERMDDDDVIFVCEVSKCIAVIDLTVTPKAKPAPKVSEPRCPLCMEGYSEIRKQWTKNFVGTDCGHVFCSFCIQKALSNSIYCPVCRKVIHSHNIIYI